ncbi:unnamed protein product [Linum tenue]|uniref:Phytocyanin domain-containing protein n=1 Tax=Linum tenue TaxID=586396 RepID=A0AAV0HHN4_9ROSI|nr:unnamed protein product [Linum tenue]
MAAAAANRCTTLAALATVIMIIPAVAMAAQHIVGDTQGWNVSVDFKKWAGDREFYVGDILVITVTCPVFNYNKSHDSVIQVRSGPDFQACVPLGDILDSGNDKVGLDTAGKWWFISGVAAHCADSQQKLVVDVEGAAAPGSGSTTPVSDPNTNAAAYSVAAGGFVAAAAAASVALAIVMAF